MTAKLPQSRSEKSDGNEKPGEAARDREAQRDKHLSAVIGAHVLHALGQPGDLHRVQVRQVWGDHYRVNVFVGPDAVTSRVAHSYFLMTDGDGNIVTAAPPITRLYQLADEAGPVNASPR